MLPALPWPGALAASAAGMLAESLPPPLDDNLTVPFAAALGATVAGSLAA
jgi:dolichol kinase